MMTENQIDGEGEMTEMKDGMIEIGEMIILVAHTMVTVMVLIFAILLIFIVLLNHI